MRRQITTLPRRSVVLAQDESDLLLFPPLRACWSPRGEPTPVLLSGSNAKRVVFGALNLRTGTRLFLVWAKSRAADFQAFLTMVRSAYRGWHVALLLDEDSCHTARASQQTAENMTLLWLPTRAPKLNPIETLWGQAKDVVSANKQYAIRPPLPRPSSPCVRPSTATCFISGGSAGYGTEASVAVASFKKRVFMAPVALG